MLRRRDFWGIPATLAVFCLAFALAVTGCDGSGSPAGGLAGNGGTGGTGGTGGNGTPGGGTGNNENIGGVEAVLVPGANLAAQLLWLHTYAQDGGVYAIELGGSGTITPAAASAAGSEGINITPVDTALPTGKTNLTIIIRSTGAERTINLAANGVLFTVGSGITLILENNVTLVGRRISHVGQNNNSPLVRINSGGTLIMNNGSKITGNHNHGHVIADSAGAVLLTSGGTFIMNGGEISGNFAYWLGGGVNNTGGTFTMHGGIISGNTAGVLTGGLAGGGVAVGGNAAFIMHNGIISGNASSSGGGVSVGRDGFFTMYNGTISGNRANGSGGSGGGINVIGTFTMHNGAISGNYTIGIGSGGGGVHVDASATFYMRGGEISGNSSQGNRRGGGVLVSGPLAWGIEGGTFNISNGVIHGSAAAAGLANMVGTGAGASLTNEGTAQHGTFNNGTFNQAGTLHTTSNTIRVVNGASL